MVTRNCLGGCASVCEIWSLTSPLFPTNGLIRLVNPAERQSLATRCLTVAPDTCTCITWQLVHAVRVCLTVGVNSKVCVDAFFLLFSLKLYIQQCNHLDWNDVVPVCVGEKKLHSDEGYEMAQNNAVEVSQQLKTDWNFVCFCLGITSRNHVINAARPYFFFNQFFAGFMLILPQSVYLLPNFPNDVCWRGQRGNPCPCLWSCAWLNQRTYLHCTGH